MRPNWYPMKDPFCKDIEVQWSPYGELNVRARRIGSNKWIYGESKESAPAVFVGMLLINEEEAKNESKG